MSEVVRMAIYEWLKNNFSKKELDYFSDREDVVEDLVDFYRNKGRAGSIDIGGDKDELDKEVSEGKLEFYDDKEFDQHVKNLQEKYKIIGASHGFIQ